MNRSCWVVLIHHDVDGGYQGTRLFDSQELAELWLTTEGYIQDRPNEMTWMKPVHGSWDDYPERSEYGGSMEVAEVYDQEILERMPEEIRVYGMEDA